MLTRRFFLSSSLIAAVTTLVPGIVRAFEGKGVLLGTFSARTEQSPTPKKTATIKEDTSGHRVVLTDMRDSRMVLNETGTFIWNNIDGEKTCHNISSLLSRDFGINPEQASNDVSVFIARLRVEGFLYLR